MLFLHGIIDSFLRALNRVINNNNVATHTSQRTVKAGGKVAGIAPFKTPLHDAAVSVLHFQPREKAARHIGFLPWRLFLQDHVLCRPGKLRRDDPVIRHRDHLVLHILPIAPVHKVRQRIGLPESGRQVDDQIFYGFPCLFTDQPFLIGRLQCAAQCSLILPPRFIEIRFPQLAECPEILPPCCKVFVPDGIPFI